MCLTLLFLANHLLGLDGVFMVPCGDVLVLCCCLVLGRWLVRWLLARTDDEGAAGSRDVEDLNCGREGGRGSPATGQSGLEEANAVSGCRVTAQLAQWVRMGRHVIWRGVLGILGERVLAVLCYPAACAMGEDGPACDLPAVRGTRGERVFAVTAHDVMRDAMDRCSAAEMSACGGQPRFPDVRQECRGIFRDVDCRAGGVQGLFGLSGLSSGIASPSGRVSNGHAPSEEERCGETVEAEGRERMGRDLSSARVCPAPESCLALQRIANALEEASLQRRLEHGNRGPGALAQLMGVNRWAVFVARGCDTFDVKWCKGLLGLDLYHGLRRAGAAPSMCSDFAGLRIPITNRLAFGAAAGSWGRRRAAGTKTCTLTAAEFKPWTDYELDGYVQPEGDDLESPPREDLDGWAQQTVEQVKVFACLYGAEHTVERIQARDLLLQMHEGNPVVYSLEEIANWWEELWWYWWQVVEEVLHTALPTEYGFNVDPEFIRRQVFLRQRQGDGAPRWSL